MRDDALQEVQLPAEAWNQADTTQALRDRRVGHLFRLARKYGASQTRIANVTGMGQAEVSRIQSGDRRVVAIDVLEHIASGLQMPDEQRLTLGLAPLSRHREQESNSAEQRSAGTRQEQLGQPPTSRSRLPSEETDAVLELARGSRLSTITIEALETPIVSHHTSNENDRR